MAVPTVADTTINASVGTTLTVNMPATRPDGAFFVCVAMKDDDPPWTNIPSNWNEIFQIPDGTQCRLGAWWWIGDSEPSSYSLTMDNETAESVVLRINGVNLATPIDDFDTDTGSSTNATSPESTVTQADTLVIRCAVVDRDEITATPVTELTKGGGGGAADVGWGVSREDGPASGGTGTKSFTNANDEWVAATIVIAPFSAFTAANLSDVVFSDQNYSQPPIEV